MGEIIGKGRKATSFLRCALKEKVICQYSGIERNTICTHSPLFGKTTFRNITIYPFLKRRPTYFKPEAII